MLQGDWSSDVSSSDLAGPYRVVPWIQIWPNKPVPTTPEEFAAIYQHWFELLLENLKADQADHPFTNLIVNIPLQHPQLFGVKDRSEERRVGKSGEKCG